MLSSIESLDLDMSKVVCLKLLHFHLRCLYSADTGMTGLEVRSIDLDEWLANRIHQQRHAKFSSYLFLPPVLNQEAIFLSFFTVAYEHHCMMIAALMVRVDHRPANVTSLL
jgi:hypothetical protein